MPDARVEICHKWLLNHFSEWPVRLELFWYVAHHDSKECRTVIGRTSNIPSAYLDSIGAGAVCWSCYISWWTCFLLWCFYQLLHVHCWELAERWQFTPFYSWNKWDCCKSRVSVWSN